MRSIDALLRDIARTDIRDGYVVPNKARARQLGALIAAETEAALCDLTEEDCAGKTEPHIVNQSAAARDAFAANLRPRIANVIKAIKEKRAKRIDVAFHNTVCLGNEWGDQVLLAIRYTR